MTVDIHGCGCVWTPLDRGKKYVSLLILLTPQRGPAFYELRARSNVCGQLHPASGDANDALIDYFPVVHKIVHKNLRYGWLISSC